MEVAGLVGASGSWRTGVLAFRLKRRSFDFAQDDTALVIEEEVKQPHSFAGVGLFRSVRLGSV